MKKMGDSGGKKYRLITESATENPKKEVRYFQSTFS
jgi:hypothetical protein